MKTYSLHIEDGLTLIRWSETEGDTTTSGLFVEGRAKTRQVKTGTDEEGNDVYESETYEPFAEIMNDPEITVIDKRPTTEELQLKAKEEQRQSLKTARDLALQGITHTFADGTTVQVRPQDIANFALAIEVGEPQDWVMADNSVKTLSVDDLNEAMQSGKAQGKAIWKAYTDGLKAL
jgi:hypothetical protein